MGKTIEIKVPDIGDFKDVEVIEVLVQPDERVEKEDSLITLESEKASMEIPSPEAGFLRELRVKVGDRVNPGDPIATIESDADSEGATEAASEASPSAAASTAAPPAPAAGPEPTGDVDVETEVLVLGSGPGGYTAAFRAADLGKRVVMVERFDKLGGVCLNVGCIPSKALLHVAEVMNEAREFKDLGVDFGEPAIDKNRLRAHKDKIVGRLTGGLDQLASQRQVRVVNGYGRFTSPHTIAVESTDGSVTVVKFESCVVAVGSSVAKLPFVPWDDARVWDSTDALELAEIPERMLVVGGGIIGLEMASVYHALGTKITVVELTPDLMPGADRDLIRPFEKIVRGRYEKIYTSTKVTAIEPSSQGLVCKLEGEKAPQEDCFDVVLVAIGRSPNGKRVDAEKAGLAVDERGFIPVDKQQRTNVAHIFAIGDVVGEPMLAHKATHEGKVAAEVIAGEKAFFDARTIPSVAYTDPEVAWCGLTEAQAKAQGVEYERGVFPWVASGRALSSGTSGGMTKLLFEKETRRVIGAGVVGRNAGELIGETVLAVEMGADVHDIGLTIHPHPTLSETVGLAAEVAAGTVTDIPSSQPRRS